MSTEYQQNGTDDETSSEKVKRGDVGPSVLTHGLQHLQHFPSDDAPVRHMTHGEGPAAAVLSLHGGGVARAYHPEDGRLRATLRPPVEFAGLTGTGLAGRVAGWGPGARLALLDGELRPLARAADPPDVRACRASERTLELVTAGEGNVCVWCLHHLLCKVRVREGLGPRDVFTLLALAPPAAGRHHRAYAACGSAVALVDLTEGRLLERRRSLHLREITSMVHCPLLDCLVTASRDTSIRVWGPDWALLITFVSHTDVVTALTSCPLSGLIISASLDGTLRCWSLEEGDQVQMVHVEGGAPPLGLGGPGAGGTFYSFSERGVDFWGMNSLCHLHCRLGADGHHSGHRGGPLRQVVVPPSPPPFPPRALCVSGDGSLALVAMETGAVLSSFAPGEGRRVKGADYCPYRETLLVLTEEGAVLRASALTNPAAALDDWRGAWEEPWPEGRHVDEDGDGRPPRPGPASCLTLYSAVTDHKEALEDWQALRGLEDLRAVKRRSRLDARNWFLVMLGQERGCVSVLKWNSGEVLYRAPAHSGQNVTALQADPGNGYLFSAGEDRTVQVWKVCPLAPDCLSPHLSLPCGLLPVRLASLGPLLALALQEPHSATYCLLHVCLETQSPTEHPPSQDHLDCITGLCACPQLGVLASSSRDGTIRIWDDENRLLRILQLNAEPECLAYCRQSGDLLLGIRGDLYRIPKNQLLPSDLHIQLLCAEQFEPLLDIPTPETRRDRSTHRCASSCAEGEEGHSQAEETTDTEHSALLARSRDLQALQQGAVMPGKKKKKLPTTRRMKREAFARYLKLVFPEPLRTEIPMEMEDAFGLQGVLFPPRRPTELRPLPPHRGGAANASLQKSLWGFIPNSVVLAELWPGVVGENALPQTPWALREGLGLLSENDAGEVKLLVCDDDDDDDDDGGGDDSELKLRHLLEKQDTLPRPMTPPAPPTRPVVESVRPRFRVPKCPLIVRRRKADSPPPPTPKPPTPSPPRTTPPKPPPPPTPPHQSPVPHTPPPRPPPPPSPPPPPAPLPPPSPHHEEPQPPTPPCPIPEFLSPFVDQDWFQEVFPEHSLLHSSLSPEAFALLLLQKLRCCQAGSRTHILNALTQLLRQGALKNSKQISAGLTDLLQIFATSGMLQEDRRFVCELLKAVVSVGSDSTDTMVELLTILAHKELGLQGAVLRLLKSTGVEEADPWLSLEVATWRSGTRAEPKHTWAHLRQVAARWLDFWTCKYQQDRALLLRGVEEKQSFAPVDVLRFFCSTQRENQNRPPAPAPAPPAPEGRKDTVLRHQHLYRKPILRLGETHSLARARQTKRAALPPLPHRPLLEGFVPFISLPLPRVSLCPFPCLQDRYWPKGALQRRYFIPEHSCTDYYR